MGALEAALGHFSELKTRKLEVPEWGDDEGPLEIYWSPWTLAERKKLISEGGETEEDVQVNIVVGKAQDADGNPLFGKADKEKLKRGAHSKVLQRIASTIVLDLNSASVESALGN